MSSEPLTLFDIVPGRVIADRFTVVGTNRQGGFSTTFEVTDREDDSRCELQLYPSGLFDGNDQARQFRAQLQPWTRIRSDAVLQVREILQFGEDNLLLITALPTGETLRERLNGESSLPREEVIGLGCHLLEGLEQIHAQHLVHGDIKPHTIHVNGTGRTVRAQLVDGGVTPGLWTAKDLGEKTALIGTPYYAPVEQFGGDAPDVRSDIYNIATVLYECLAGVLPWPGKSFLEVFQAKLQDPPPMRTRAPGIEVDGALEEIIRKGGCADRRKRYGAAAEFRSALEALQD